MWLINLSVQNGDFIAANSLCFYIKTILKITRIIFKISMSRRCHMIYLGQIHPGC